MILEYLVYSGIVMRDERGLSLSSAGPRTTELPVGPPAGAEEISEKSAPELQGWHMIQTEDFVVRVKSDLAVVGDLKSYLTTLENKIKRQNESRSKGQDI